MYTAIIETVKDELHRSEIFIAIIAAAEDSSVGAASNKKILLHSRIFYLKYIKFIAPTLFLHFRPSTIPQVFQDPL